MLPAGKYYVGDLCYFIPNDLWHKFINETEDTEGYQFKEGEGVFKGVPYAEYYTKYGDGRYPAIGSKSGDRDTTLGVDSGSIGCMLINETTKDYKTDGGFVEDFPNDFETYEFNGKLVFGHIEVETEDLREDEEDDDDYYVYEGEDDDEEEDEEDGEYRHSED